ncbi:hypothetical protein BD324DRAFT_638726 [Kockovaella imperatae]|uniref:Uncharacterized protein n=1 Tax=Kockovaella imperatae TaxID=4999 RepID=A0A1Y1U722_9TREE|nr:hypothetical protein BD324DRAFT_638726 [Kockovaella imperatae]ORX33821.1 hypothetical protein BD324DRAFT_638726 [Kockovaella imperatae]
MEATWLYLTRVRAALTGAAKHPSPVPEPSADVQAIDLVKEYNLDTAKPFDPQALQRHLDTWIPELMHHLAEEIGTLGPNMTEKVGEEDLVKLDTLIKERLLQYDPAWFLCSAYATMPIEEAKENLKLPMLVRRLMIPFWWGSKYWGMWLYCDFPENLTFAGTA